MFTNLLNDRRQLVFVMITAAVLICGFDYPAEPEPIRTYHWIFRLVLYVALILAWLIYISQRIIHPQIKLVLQIMAVLMVFFHLVVFAKIFSTVLDAYNHHLWYLYYVPILFIPLLFFYISILLDHPEGKGLSRASILLSLPFFLLLGLVLTNDLHQQVFVFPNGMTGFGKPYRQNWGYWVIYGSTLAISLKAFHNLLMKCRIPGHKTAAWPTFTLIGAFALYSVLYALKCPLISLYFNDLSAVHCLLYILIVESLIQNKFIQSNSNYGELFDHLKLPVAIAGRDGQLYGLESDAAPSAVKKILSGKKDALWQEKGLLLRKYPLSRGVVIWQEDHTALTDANQALEKVNSDLARQNDLAVREYSQKIRQARVRQLNHLFDQMNKAAQKKTAEMATLMTKLEKAPSRQEQKPLLKRMAAIGTYLKRKNNLLLLQEQQDSIHSAELYYSIREMMETMEACQVLCGLKWDMPLNISVQLAHEILDFFCETVEISLNTLQACLINLCASNGQVILRMNISTCLDPEQILVLEDERTEIIADEDDEWLIRTSWSLK